MRPSGTPIGLLLAQTAKAVSRAFDDALAEAGGSLPTWLVLMSLMRDGPLGHGELAERVGVQGPTLTHHLDGLEQRGLVRRERPPGNRRAQVASLTEAGTAMFHRLRQAAQAHDARLRAGLAAEDLEQLRSLLGHLSANVSPSIQEDPTDDR
ncbi:MarR family winged helix-turn-helix transcriptional regulator [Inquilinus sp. YAF38]|uniref:MarR family winged helix-turn-helix transcriptional regulator n=1 Tax=Inquilinus sp. YAF38 TaxID=3233084 RepID=UPI003F92FC91